MGLKLPRRFTAFYWLSFASLLVLWAVVARWIAPRVIEAAYDGRSLPILNAVISGQGEHAVGDYLRAWSKLSRTLTFLLLLLGPVLYVLVFFRGTVRRLAGQAVAALSVGAGRPFTLFLLAVFVGLVAGIADAGYAMAWNLSEHSPTGEFYWDLLWMAPLATTAVFLGAAVVLWVLARTLGDGVLRLAPFALVVVATYGLVRSLGGIHPFAAALLAVGLGFQAVRLTVPRLRVVRSLVRRSTLALLTAVLGLAVGTQAVRSVAERRAIAGLPPAAPGAPNVLLLILDTVRAQSLSLYGYSRETSPQLERWAARGVVFDQAIATAPWTLPSHASLFTGYRHHENSADFMVPLDGTHPTLAEVLRARGYETAGFVGNFYYASARSGLARGFVHYEDQPWRIAITSSWLSRRLYQSIENVRHHRHRLVFKRAQDVNEAFLQWLSGRGSRPFFAFLNYFDAHDPYDPPAPFKTRFAAPGSQYWVPFHREYTPEQLAELRNSYEGAVSYADDRLGWLLDRMEERGALENTIVVIASDHGEEFGEHGSDLVQHAHSLYLPLLHVPLVILFPRSIPAESRVRAPVSIRDIPATVLDLLGVPLPGGFGGQSLVPLWSGAGSGSGAVADPPVSEVHINPREAESLPDSWPVSKGVMRSIVEGPNHYILNGDGREELYDIENDPWEQNDLSGSDDGRRIVQRLRSLLRSTVATTAVRPAGARPEAVDSSPAIGSP